MDVRRANTGESPLSSDWAEVISKLLIYPRRRAGRPFERVCRTIRRGGKNEISPGKEEVVWTRGVVLNTKLKRPDNGLPRL